MRGLYGQSEGNERRHGQTAAQEHYQDNYVVEDEAVRTIRGFMQRKHYGTVDVFVAGMRRNGWSEVRIQCVLTAAMRGLRLS